MCKNRRVFEEFHCKKFDGRDSFFSHVPFIPFVLLRSWSAYGNKDGDHNGDADGSDYWYMGRTNSAFRANAAYSLYGVLKDKQQSRRSNLGSPKNSKHMCQKSTFINSFFTTAGAQTLSNALGTIQTNDINYVTSTCTSGVDDSGSDWSMTMGCNEKGGFIYANFTGKYCEGFYFEGTVLEMTNYTNAMMEEFNCLQVWDYDAYLTQTQNSNRHLQKDDAGSNQYGYGSVAEQLLYHSKACDLNLYPHDCPDPFGMKDVYDINFQRAEVGLGPTNFSNPNKPFILPTLIMFLLATIMTSLAYDISPDQKKQRVHSLFCPCCFGSPSEKEITEEEYDEEYDSTTASEVSSQSFTTESQGIHPQHVQDDTTQDSRSKTATPVHPPPSAFSPLRDGRASVTSEVVSHAKPTEAKSLRLENGTIFPWNKISLHSESTISSLEGAFDDWSVRVVTSRLDWNVPKRTMSAVSGLPRGKSSSPRRLRDSWGLPDRLPRTDETSRRGGPSSSTSRSRGDWQDRLDRSNNIGGSKNRFESRAISSTKGNRSSQELPRMVSGVSPQLADLRAANSKAVSRRHVKSPQANVSVDQHGAVATYTFEKEYLDRSPRLQRGQVDDGKDSSLHPPVVKSGSHKPRSMKR